MPLTTREGGLRQKRTNGAAIIRPVFPVNDPNTAARFVQFLIDHKYAPAPTAALFITAGIERRFTYRVAKEIGVPLRRLCRYVTLARRVLTSQTVIVPPVEDLPAEQEPKHNPRITDYWHKIRTRDGADLRNAVKMAIAKTLDREPQLSDSKLARMLTGQMRIAISRRTVTKYRLSLGTRRQGTMKAAIAEALEHDPELTDAELAVMLSKSTRTPISPISVARNRIKLGIRHRRPNRRRRTAKPAGTKPGSEKADFMQIS